MCDISFAEKHANIVVFYFNLFFLHLTDYSMCLKYADYGMKCYVI